MPGKRLYTISDKARRSTEHDRIVRCVEQLPDSDVGHSLFNSLQTILLKGNQLTKDEKVVYETFLTLLHAAQNHELESAREEKMDACQDFLKTKLISLEGRSQLNGKP